MDGCIYALCPIVPFGSVFNFSGIEELKKDAGQLSSDLSIPNSTVAGNASRPAAWLEAVFPDLCNEPSISSVEVGASSVLKACAYVPLDASLDLQGPFPTVWGENLTSDKYVPSNHLPAAANLSYNNVGKDSILAVNLRDGQLLLYALADEVQPMWNMDGTSRVVVDDDGHLLSAAMLVETRDVSNKPRSMRATNTNVEQIHIGDAGLTGQPPPLLKLARVDLALEKRVLETAPLSVLMDPVVPERLYCYHAAGVDVILLQWLPFSDQYTRRTTPGVPPVVFPVLDIRAPGDVLLLPMLGVTTILDILGETWLAAVTPSGKAVVIEMDGHRILPTHCFEGAQESEQEKKLNDAAAGTGTFPLISAELLRGPKDIHIPQVTSSGSPLTLSTIEGRTLLHDQCKLLREKYIEYAHRMYVELSSHGIRLDAVLQDLHKQLHHVQETLKQAQVTSNSFSAKVQQAFDKNRRLHERIKKFSMLPGVRLKPLTAAEQIFKAELDTMQFQDLDMLRSAVDVLSVRAERIANSQKKHQQRSSYSSQYLQASKINVPDFQMRRLKQAVDQLTQVVDTTSNHTKVVEEEVKHREVMANRRLK
ncbi:hypothetical protein O6H91_16G054400 [Diphasiastrum complanatum]|nr:hypothetical protein O6H91_16G054400 [Diphasiastrum complanatum]